MINDNYFKDSFSDRLSIFINEICEIQKNNQAILNINKNKTDNFYAEKDNLFFYKTLNNINFLDYLNNNFLNENQIKQLISNKPKLVLCSEAGIYHFWVNTAAMCFEWLKKNPGGIIVLSSEYSNYEEMKSINSDNFNELTLNSDFTNYLKKYLLSIGSDLIIFNFNFLKCFPIKNFQIIKDHNQNINKSFLLNINNFKNFINKNNNIKPYRKVYISKREKTSTDDEKMKNEIELEKYLQSIGFEIINPKDFKNIEEQINYFQTVKTLMATTGSALGNGIFMNEYTKIIEICTPITYYNKTVLQNFYLEMSYGLNLNYLLLSNNNKNAKEVIEQIELTDGLKKYLMS